MATNSISSAPDHIPNDRLFDFDLYGLSGDPRLSPDVQKGLGFLHSEAPDLFFTPRNGGHWVATRTELMTRILRDPEHFSSVQLNVPKAANPQRLIPLTLDPPEHTAYRLMLMRMFSPQRVATLEGDVRHRARQLIRKFVERDSGDFMDGVAIPLPVGVFMDLMGLPAEKLGRFRTIVVEWFSLPNGPRRIELAAEVKSHIGEAIAERRASRQSDLISALLDEQIDGRPLDESELESICFLLFLAGLDTVANAAGFMIARLARLPLLQAELRSSEDRRKLFLDEVLRTSGVVTTARMVTSDLLLDNVTLKAGDMVMCPLALAGYDARANSCPETFDIGRRGAAHLMFSTGPHLCVGHFLARMELRVLLEEWLDAVSSFSADDERPMEVRIGSITALVSLHLNWQTSA